MPKTQLKTNAFNQLDKLRSYYFDEVSLRIIDEKEQSLRKLLDSSRFKELKEVQAIISDARQRKLEINTLLTVDDKLTTEQRVGLFHERDVHDFYLSRFDPEIIMRNIQSIEKYAEQELKCAEKEVNSDL